MSDQASITSPAATALRAAMARFSTGVVVLTVGGAHVHGMTANAFSSVSLAPPQILCCVAHSAVMHKAISNERRFAVSVLAAEQEWQARYFADKERPLGPEQFESVDWRPGPHTGAPLVAGALAWLECELTDSHSSADHSIFIGSVLHSALGPARQGLLFFDGGFHAGAVAGG